MFILNKAKHFNCRKNIQIKDFSVFGYVAEVEIKNFKSLLYYSLQQKAPYLLYFLPEV